MEGLTAAESVVSTVIELIAASVAGSAAALGGWKEIAWAVSRAAWLGALWAAG